MASREEIMGRLKAAKRRHYDMPLFDDINPTVYPDVMAAFVDACIAAGCNVEEVESPADIDAVVRRRWPDAAKIASDLPAVTSANISPDAVGSPADLDGVDVGVIAGEFGVAENGCIWVKPAMKERAVCFIAENLVIAMPRDAVNNMHEAYARAAVDPSAGYAAFISGPSKTADIAQVLVMGAQAARTLTVILVERPN